MMGMAPSGGTVSSSRPAVAEEQEVMKIYLKNGAYKSLLIKTSTKVGDVCAMMAGKLNLEEHSNSFDLLDVQRDKSMPCLAFLLALSLSPSPLSLSHTLSLFL